MKNTQGHSGRRPQVLFAFILLVFAVVLILLGSIAPPAGVIGIIVLSGLLLAMSLDPPQGSSKHSL